jgi:hypothetical protein
LNIDGVDPAREVAGGFVFGAHRRTGVLAQVEDFENSAVKSFAECGLEE